MVAESWFRGLWKIPRKHESGTEKVFIGVLAFEVASLMAKLVHLWQSLSDKQVSRLSEEISNSVGVKKLVSEDEGFIGSLICAELIESMVHVAKSVARLEKKCSDPALRSFDHVFDDLFKFGTDTYGWEFSYKKMDKKVKKMERFISINATLYQEMEFLADLEQTVKRMKGNDPEPENLLDYQKKLVWKKHEVKNLREISLWNKTYDYTLVLLVRSLFTIFNRINYVFGTSPVASSVNSKILDSDNIYRSQSVSTLLQNSNLPSESSSIPRFASGPLGGYSAKSGPISKPNKTNHFYSGPLSSPAAKSGPISQKNRNGSYFSGPLGKSTTKNGSYFSGPLGKSITKSGPISTITKGAKKMWQTQSPVLQGKKLQSKPNRLTQVGPFKGCMIASNTSPVANCYINSTLVHLRNQNEVTDNEVEIITRNVSAFTSQFKLLDALPDTLGAAALALHYANVIVVIEKLAASPHLIGHDARDDLYNMLPLNVRTALRARLKPYSKSLASAVYDTSLAGEWNEAISSILEWLAPLAHNMIRWQSERSFEQQNFVSRTNVLLVQTLYFANQEKTEATITELLVGLNYIWRLGRELNAKALQECASGRVHDEYMDHDK
ncbi:protein PSK SIMULATOR 1 [Mercurialis annua]|uniref:protein PSK SIMULATOR 1 n=1 Tax=Mercurialis annua TaxID=3986 RepID=UPI00215E5C1B|nr:protein PSK SIMULATOR 1 [Mercurialis annua]XP_050210512.1 protein PSK SIMULATOR 1 [Mercurialis annua]XP_050210513.1 protein PSK SIMULATOR 1 [Mercurialis annua]